MPPDDGLNNKSQHEKALVARLKAGDSATEQEFFKLYRDGVFRAASYILGARSADAEDMVQETFLSAHKNLANFEFRASLATWLNRICVNKCFNLLQKRKREIVEADVEIHQNTGNKLADWLQKEADQQHRDDLFSLVAGQMKKLKETCKKILEWRYREGLEYAALSQKLKIPIGTVMSRLARCKTRLKMLVKEAAKEVGHG